MIDTEKNAINNFFDHIRDEQGALTLLNSLFQNTTPKCASKDKPFFEKAEIALLKACCFYLLSECHPGECTLSNVVKLLCCGNADEGYEDEDSTLDIMMNDLKKKDPEHIAVLSYAVFKSAGGGNAARDILTSCKNRLANFNLSDNKEKLVDLLDGMFNGGSCVDKADAADYLMANGVTIQKWFIMEERLPTKEDADKHGRVLAIFHDALPQPWNWQFVRQHYKSFTHWMSMPEPPTKTTR